MRASHFILGIVVGVLFGLSVPTAPQPGIPFEAWIRCQPEGKQVANFTRRDGQLECAVLQRGRLVRRYPA
jgi:hypothetical protein